MTKPQLIDLDSRRPRKPIHECWRRIMLAVVDRNLDMRCIKNALVSHRQRCALITKIGPLCDCDPIIIVLHNDEIYRLKSNGEIVNFEPATTHTGAK